jgi:hypothetical protein
MNQVTTCNFLIIFNFSSLSQGSYILRHEKKEPYATVYKTAEQYSLQTPADSQKIDIKIDRETVPFVPLVWKGTKTQIIGTFPIQAEPSPDRKKFCSRGKCVKKKVILRIITF